MEKIIKTNENGDYFLKLLRSENEKLERLVNKAELELENGRNLSEEICGKLRIAAGKAKLLMRKKFCQFEELCKQNLGYGPGEQFKVTNSDLAGYWDVVMIQISQIHNIFEQCYELMKDKRQVESIPVRGRSVDSHAGSDLYLDRRFRRAFHETKRDRRKVF